MLATSVDAVDFLAQLDEEIVSAYDVTDETMTNICTALLAMQTHTTPITLGTIEPTTTRSLKVEDHQDTILGVLSKLRETVGGYIEVDTDRQLNWWNDIGEDKGQQIRYKKNVKGLSRTLEFTNFGNRLYCYGEGEGDARIELSDATDTTILGSAVDGTNNLAADNVVMDRFEVTNGGVVTSIKVYSRANGNAKVAIYNDNGGSPSDLIVANNTGQAVILNQWNTLEIDDVYLAPGFYWLAANTDTSGVTSRRGAGTGTLIYKAVAYAGYTFPDSAGTGFTTTTFEYAIAGWFIVSENYVEDTVSQGEHGICIRLLADKSITHPDTLLAWAFQRIAEMKDPRASYRVDMVNLVAQGWEFESLQLGSIVKVIDEDLGIDIEARIVKVLRDLSAPNNIQVEISNVTKDIIDTMTGVKDTQQFYDHLATKIGAGQVTVLGAFTVIDWVTGGTTNIIGDYIRTGTIESTNWGAAAGSQYNLDDGTFKLGGSAAPKLSWDGTTLKIIGTLQTSNIEGGSVLTVNGTISAGAGGILIDSTGLKVRGATLYLQTAAGVTKAYLLYSDAVTTAQLVCADGIHIGVGSYAETIGISLSAGRTNPTGTTKPISLNCDYLDISANWMVLPMIPVANQPAGVKGRFYFDTTNNLIKYYNGSAWKTIATV